MKLKTFEEAEKYLYSTIPSSYSKKYPAGTGIKRVKSLLKKLDNPQEKLKIVHIAGTSGKGSTATMTEKILRSHGMKTGLTLSPHIEDIRERFQVNGRLLESKKFVEYLNDITHAVKKTNKEFEEEITYFEVLIVLAYYIFEKEKVDVAVVETGMGGTYDATNVVERRDKICVITRIGKDHTNVLGSTLEEITKNKAGIIQKGNSVVALKQEEKINNVLEKRSEKVGATLEMISERSQSTNRIINNKLWPSYQKENLSLAVAASKIFLVQQEKEFSFEKTENALKDFRFKGRFDIVRLKGKEVIVDGAHNLQKMTAFLDSLKKRYKNKKFVFLVAFKKDKDSMKMLKEIIPLAKEIIITEFFSKKKDVPKLAQDAKEIAQEVHLLTKRVKVRVIKNPKKAFEAALKEKEDVVVTGSLYLATEVYPCLN